MVRYFPEDPDSWSETLTPPEGVWISGYWNCHVEKDLVYKRVGEASIKCVYDSYDPWNPIGTSHFFQFNEPVDLTAFESIDFMHGLQGKIVADDEEYQAFTGYCHLEVGFITYEPEVEWYCISKEYGTIPGEWEAKSFKLREMEVWGNENVEEVLKKINYIHIISYIDDEVARKVQGECSWIDYIHFTAPEVTLYVKSVPSGKHFVIDGLGFVTPQQFMGSPGEKYTINMEPAGFLHWENSDTNHIREIVLPNYDLTITAYYEEKGAPSVLPLLLISGAFITVGSLIYYYYKRRG